MPLFLIWFFVSSVAGAFEVPALTDSVVDGAHFLDESVKSELSNALKVIHQKGGPQLAVLTVETIDPLTIEEAAIQVAKTWKLGTEQKDNGVLLMVARKERKVRIEVGQGVEGDLTDAYSRRIIDNNIVPFFRNGQTSQGILNGVSGILLRMNPPYQLSDYLNQVYIEAPVQMNWARLILLIAFILFVLYLNRHSGGRGFYHGGGSSPYGFGGGFGGRGGGGWSGGGGGFSGGGASGSW